MICSLAKEGAKIKSCGGGALMNLKLWHSPTLHSDHREYDNES